jgi:hypothetical protein
MLLMDVQNLLLLELPEVMVELELEHLVLLLYIT